MSHQKDCNNCCSLFVHRKPLARRVVPKKTYVDHEEIKTPFAIIGVRSANCTRKQREDIQRWTRYEKYPELKYKYRKREFWCRGYYVDTTGKNDKRIAEYIRHQLEKDRANSWRWETSEQPVYRQQAGILRGWQTVPTRRDACASIPGLCPSMKNPRLCRGIFIKWWPKNGKKGIGYYP